MDNELELIKEAGASPPMRIDYIMSEPLKRLFFIL